ncbi:hypothetical protein POM88_024078 [Heracleum sosnowskyi]|uniref:Cytochrome P450 n=1 Tax=Heracleum sosnowskyi TaxID=360622 RepID=A0AAD8MWJ9_9APIA|nr:hypothetical protein POM88_024078 [Heracleum sosnowskyi]
MISSGRVVVSVDFLSHDFADRFVNVSMKSHEFYKSSMALGAYSSYWRTLKRICTVQLFSNKRINETVLIRQKCVDVMLSWIEKEVEKGASGGIEVIKFVFPTSFNLIGNLTVSRDLMDPYSEMASEFYSALSGIAECLGRPNISDLFPWLRWVDLQGLRMRRDRYLDKAIQIVSGFVNERVKQRQQNEGMATEHKDFLDVVLDFEGSGKDEPAKLSHLQISIFLMEMFMAGTETTSSTTEWAMTELLQNPESLKKIKAELRRVVGVNNKLTESHIDNLPYLQATIEETLRLHAPVPLVLPRKAIPEENWEDASSFKPERFLGSSIGLKAEKFPDWIIQSSVQASKSILDSEAAEEISSSVNLQPNLSQNYLGLILCFQSWLLYDYSVMTSASNVLRLRSDTGFEDSSIVIVPRSIFTVTDADHTIKFTSTARKHWIHLLYKTEDDNTTVNVEDERNTLSASDLEVEDGGHPSKRLKLLKFCI